MANLNEEQNRIPQTKCLLLLRVCEGLWSVFISHSLKPPFAMQINGQCLPEHRWMNLAPKNPVSDPFTLSCHKKNCYIGIRKWIKHESQESNTKRRLDNWMIPPHTIEIHTVSCFKKTCWVSCGCQTEAREFIPWPWWQLPPFPNARLPTVERPETKKSQPWLLTPLTSYKKWSHIYIL